MDHQHHDTPSTLFKVLECAGYVVTFICVILSIHGNLKLFAISHEMFISKRAKPIVFGLNIALTIEMIATTIALFAHIYGFLFIEFISYTFVVVSWLCLIFFWNIKSWMIFYKEKWTFYTLRLKWQKIINNNLITENTNWFIQNHYKYGNIKYMFKIFGIYHLIAIILAIFGMMNLFNIHGSNEMDIATLAVYIPFVISFIFFVFITIKTTRLSVIDDLFYIHWEIRMHAKLLILFVMLQCIYILCEYMINFLSHSNNLIIFTPLFNMSTYLIIYISTYCIYNKCYHPISYEGEESSTKSSKSTLIVFAPSTPSTPSTPNSPTNSPTNSPKLGSIKYMPPKPKKISLKAILRKDLSIHLFMLHLSKEFSMECLLSYIELTQYQLFIKRYFKNISFDDRKYFIIDLPKKTPISSIITKHIIDNNNNHNNNNNNKEVIESTDNNPIRCIINEYDGDKDKNIILNAKKAAYSIYDKYIKIGSEFEVNISSQLRTSCSDILNDEEILLNDDNICIEDICLLFERIKLEMMLLLQFSMSRFKQRDEFDKIIEIFINNQAPKTIKSIPKRLTKHYPAINEEEEEEEQQNNINDKEQSQSLQSYISTKL